MNETAVAHPQPWTESEYFGLRETTSRIELFDGCLWVGPQPGNAHQEIAYRLANAVDDCARASGLRAHPAMRLRLSRDRVTFPDLVVDDGDWGADFTWASEAVLVGEVASENTSLADQILKRRLYAEASVAWYLLVEPIPPAHDAITLRLLRLADDHYVEHAAAEHGQTLISEDPFPLEIHTADLRDRVSAQPSALTSD